VGPGNHVLNGGPYFLMGRGSFKGRKGRPIVKYRDNLRSSVQKRGPKESCVKWESTSPVHGMGNFGRKGRHCKV